MSHLFLVSFISVLALLSFFWVFSVTCFCVVSSCADDAKLFLCSTQMCVSFCQIATLRTAGVMSCAIVDPKHSRTLFEVTRWLSRISPLNWYYLIWCLLVVCIFLLSILPITIARQKEKGLEVWYCSERNPDSALVYEYTWRHPVEPQGMTWEVLRSAARSR